MCPHQRPISQQEGTTSPGTQTNWACRDWLWATCFGQAKALTLQSLLFKGSPEKSKDFSFCHTLKILGKEWNNAQQKASKIAKRKKAIKMKKARKDCRVRANSKLNFLWPKMARFRPLFWPQIPPPPKKVYVCVLSQEMRHIDFFLGPHRNETSRLRNVPLNMGKWLCKTATLSTLLPTWEKTENSKSAPGLTDVGEKERSYFSGYRMVFSSSLSIILRNCDVESDFELGSKVWKPCFFW